MAAAPLGTHPVDAWGTGVLLDASERLGEIRGPGTAPTSSPRRGEVRCRQAPGMDCALSGDLRASPSDSPDQAPFGVGCGQRPSDEHERPASRLRVRSFPAEVDPAGNTTSADFSTASNLHEHPAPSLATGEHAKRDRASRDTRGDLPRVRPTTFIAHPPRLRNGPLMTSGFASWCRLARTAPPYTRSPPTPTRPRCAMCS